MCVMLLELWSEAQNIHIDPQTHFPKAKHNKCINMYCRIEEDKGKLRKLPC